VLRRHFTFLTIAATAASAGVVAMTSRPFQDSAHAQTIPNVPTLRAEAESGNVDAQFRLGKAYQTGSGVARDDAKAAEWFRKAAEQGNAGAENSLGIMYSMGLGVEKNKEEAVNWYRKAAKQGSPDAMFNLGASYYNGEGIAENPVSAYAWFLLAKEAGSTAAVDAVRRSASELGPRLSPQAVVQIGDMYEDGNDLPKNYSEAARWYRKQADKDPEAAMRLVTLLMNGAGVNRDYGEAMTLCKGAASGNHADAQFCVGYLYEHGLGVPANTKEAWKWYTEAAPRNAKAALALSDMYLKGAIVPVDRAQAFWFLFLAFRNGSLAAKAQAHSLRQELTQDEAKRLAKILKEQHLDPTKVYAFIDDPNPPESRQFLPPLVR